MWAMLGNYNWDEDGQVLNEISLWELGNRSTVTSNSINSQTMNILNEENCMTMTHSFLLSFGEVLQKKNIGRELTA